MPLPLYTDYKLLSCQKCIIDFSVPNIYHTAELSNRRCSINVCCLYLGSVFTLNEMNFHCLYENKHPLPLPTSNLFWIFTPDKISFLNIIFTLPVDWVPADYKRNFFIIVGSWIKNSESRIRKFAFSLSQYFALKNWCKTTKVTSLIQQVLCVHFQ